MKIYISHSQYHHEDKSQRIEGVIEYVNQLINGFYEFDELEPAALEVYSTDYYLSQINNGGHLQFFKNDGLKPETLQDILNGLGNMEANEHKNIFQNALHLFNQLPEALREKLLTSFSIEGLDNKSRKVLEQLSVLDSEFIIYRH